MKGCCARCGVLGQAAGGSAVLVRVNAGYVQVWVGNPRSPSGWRVVGGEYKMVPKTEALCGPCRGERPSPAPVSNPRMAEAAGFKRFSPPVR